MLNFYEKLENLLKINNKFLDEDKNLIKAKVIDSANNLDNELIELLIIDEAIKQEFFSKIKDVYVFKINHFVDFIKDKNFLDNSYTNFANKIGLQINNDFLKASDKVSLVFPYKDCILEGGQTKEEKGRNEIFFNKILAKDEINKLLEPKVLANFEYWDEEQSKKWEEFDGTIEEKTKSIKGKKLKEFTRDKDGNIKDNLLIKGNNLLAMHTIKKQFAGKVKLIYIDPPYNTGNDGFKYNDNFNHSSWLTFMKNRLEIAKELLRDDGLIFVQCDYNEEAYLKVLMDEIFGRENFINNIIWKRKFGNANELRRLGSAYDNILMFSKSKNYLINLIKEKNSKHTQEYIKSRFTRMDSIGKHKGKLWMPYPLANPGKPTKNLLYTYKGYNSPIKGWRMIEEKLKLLDDDERLYFPEDKTQRIQEKKFLDEYEGQPVDSLWTDIFVINSQATEAFNFDGQKAESLIERILKIGSNENDLILDFFSGTGTTSAVAHKMNRQWIAIEQMDYIKYLPEARLKKVVAGEQDGISKTINWKGGGSFIYMELATYNQKFIDNIEKAESTDKLIEIWQNMKTKGFLLYNADIVKFDNNLEDFKKLSFKEQQKELCNILDMNMLYVPLSESEDKNFNISEEDKKLNKLFYQNEYINTDE